MSQRQRKPRAIELSYIDAKVQSDSDGDGRCVLIEGAYIDDPKEVQRLINFLSKAKKWLSEKVAE
jgi:hypothetical protein